MSGKRPSLADSMRKAAADLPAPAIQADRPSIPQLPVPQETPAARPAGFYAATRIGKKKITASVEPAIHARLKILAVNRSTTTEALLSQAIADLLARLETAGAK